MTNVKSILKTHQIASEIINLITETEAYCYIISPYIKIWAQLERELLKASKKGKMITFVIRDTEKNSQLLKLLNTELGFEVIMIKDLHLKLFMNEKDCILASMNLYDTSQTKNIELGYKFRNTKLFKEKILDEYILEDSNSKRYSGQFEKDREEIRERIREVKEELSKGGFCVECSKSIDLDGRPYNPYYIRCNSCYYESEGEKVCVCHFCGKKSEKVFHQECKDKLIEYRDLLKLEC